MTRAAMWPVDPLVIFAIFWRIALPSYNGIIIISNYKGPVMNQSGFNGMSYVRGFVSVAHVSRWARSQNNFVPRLFHPVLCVVPNSAIASWLRASSFRPARHEKAPKQGDTWWIPMKMDQDRWLVTETLHVVFRCIQDNNFVCIRLPGDQLLFFWKKTQQQNGELEIDRFVNRFRQQPWSENPPVQIGPEESFDLDEPFACPWLVGFFHGRDNSGISLESP